MDRSAALLNDTALTVFTYEKQLPYLNIAFTDLGDRLERDNVPVTNATSAVIELEAEVDNIGDDGPPLPEGLVDIQGIYQRWGGNTNSWMLIRRYDFLPAWEEGDNQQTSFIPAWAWMEQVIKFIPANTDLEIKIDYIKSKVYELQNENSTIDIIGSLNFLAFSTAALCSMYIGENETRAASLNTQAEEDYNRLLGTATKGRQSIATRRRPFQSRYKSLRSF